MMQTSMRVTARVRHSPAAEEGRASQEGGFGKAMSSFHFSVGANQATEHREDSTTDRDQESFSQATTSVSRRRGRT